jgi:hypothetical protein
VAAFKLWIFGHLPVLLLVADIKSLRDKIAEMLIM